MIFCICFGILEPAAVALTCSVGALWSFRKKKPSCPCCNRKVDVLKKPVWVSEPVCGDCIKVWLDEGITDPDKIKEKVLAKG